MKETWVLMVEGHVELSQNLVFYSDSFLIFSWEYMGVS